MMGGLWLAFGGFLAVVVVVWWKKRRRRREAESEGEYLCFHCREEAEDRCRLPERPFARHCIAYTPMPDQPELDESQVPE